MSIVDLPQRPDAQQALDDKAAEEFKASWFNEAMKPASALWRRYIAGLRCSHCGQAIKPEEGDGQ